MKAWLSQRFGTPEAVYGLILYAALIAASSTEHSDSLEVLLIAGGTLLVFWAAHVFARVVTVHGEEHHLGAAIREGVTHSSGMLWASLPSTLVLIISLFTAEPPDVAADFSLLIAMIVLGILGYNAYARRGHGIVARIIGAIVTAFFGFIIIILDLLVH